jgi:hypothetical protein
MSPPSPISRDTDAATSNNASTAPHLLPPTVVMVTRLGDCALERVSSSPSNARGIPNQVHDGSRAATMEHIADAGAPGHRIRMCMKTRRAEGVQAAAGGDNRLPDLVRSNHDERIYACYAEGQEPSARLAREKTRADVGLRPSSPQAMMGWDVLTRFGTSRGTPPASRVGCLRGATGQDQGGRGDLGGQKPLLAGDITRRSCGQ